MSDQELKEIRYEDVEVGMVVRHAGASQHWEVVRLADEKPYACHRVKRVAGGGQHETDLSRTKIYLVAAPVKVTVPQAEVDWSRWAPPGPTKPLANVTQYEVGMVTAVRLGAYGWIVMRVDRVRGVGVNQWATGTVLASDSPREVGRTDWIAGLWQSGAEAVVVQGAGEAEPRDPRVVYAEARADGWPKLCGLACGRPNDAGARFACIACYERLPMTYDQYMDLKKQWQEFRMTAPRPAAEAKKAVEEVIAVMLKPVPKGAVVFMRAPCKARWESGDGRILMTNAGCDREAVTYRGLCATCEGMAESMIAAKTPHTPREPPPAPPREAKNVRVGSFDVTHGLASTLSCEPRNLRPEES